MFYVCIMNVSQSKIITRVDAIYERNQDPGLKSCIARSSWFKTCSVQTIVLLLRFFFSLFVYSFALKPQKVLWFGHDAILSSNVLKIEATTTPCMYGWGPIVSTVPERASGTWSENCRPTFSALSRYLSLSLAVSLFVWV